MNVKDHLTHFHQEKEANYLLPNYPAGNYMFKVNNRNTRTRCKICSKLTIKTPERRQWRRSGVFIVNFEHILHLVLVFLLLTLSRYTETTSDPVAQYRTYEFDRKMCLMG